MQRRGGVVTTKVIVTSPLPNHRPLTVNVQTKQPDGSWFDGPPQRVALGNSHEFYVHGYQRLLIEEVPEGAE